MAPEVADSASWRRIALDPPRAWGEPPASGTIRAESADFVVEERLGFEPDGGGAHFLLRVEKQDANTLHVARELAASVGRPTAEIGFAGMKDRRAIARQWFSVPFVKGKEPAAGTAGNGYRVLAAHPHSRKLRRGALQANHFHLRVRDLSGDSAALAIRLALVASQGFPNYYGVQRFGIDGANLTRVQQWLERGWLPRGREARAFILSSARALAFNAVLAQRVADGSWNRLLAGDIANLAGSGSVFAVDRPDDTLHERCRAGDISPTGPLCGEGGMQPIGDAARTEIAVLAALDPLPARLGGAGMRAERRALIVRPAGFRHEFAEEVLELEFELPRGAFATSLLREVLVASVPEVGTD